MKKFISHFLLATVFFTLLLILFIYAVLPIITHQGETVKVPDVTKMQPHAAAKLLQRQDLNYEVEDSVFEENMQANSIVSQHPEPGDEVKIKREIDLVINKEIPPKVRMPRLVNQSLELARYNINTVGLTLGEIKYKPFYVDSLVIEQLHDGRPVTEGEKIHLTTPIDLVVGYQSEEGVVMPDLRGLPLEAARNKLEQYDLILNVPKNKYGAVVRQFPVAKARVKKGSLVEVMLE